MNIERTLDGKISLRLSEDSEQFKRLAEIIKKRLCGHWTGQFDHFDQSYWDMDVDGANFTMHREHYLGVFIFCDDSPLTRSLLEQIKREFESTKPI